MPLRTAGMADGGSGDADTGNSGPTCATELASIHHKPPSGPSASSTLIYIKIQHHFARKLACGVRQSLRPSLSRTGLFWTTGREPIVL
jgi:hypothetical protein